MSKQLTQTSNKAASHTAWQTAIAAPIASALVTLPIAQKLGLPEYQITAAIAALVGYLLSFIKSDLVSRKQNPPSKPVSDPEQDFTDIGFE